MWIEQDRENLRMVKEFGEIANGKKLSVIKASETFRPKEIENSETVLQQLKNRENRGFHKSLNLTARESKLK